MTKRQNSKYKCSRSLGVKLWGENKVRKEKNYPPGQHGPKLVMRRKTDYGIHLQAKQKLKFYYANIKEYQFRNLYKLAKKLKGDTGENLIGLLERRLDTVIYRAGFAPSMFAARQFINHKHVLVNGKTVNIGSYRLKIGDEVKIKDKFADNVVLLTSVQNIDNSTPGYIEVNNKTLTAKLLSVPAFADVPYPVVMEPNLIIEYYSR